MAGMLLVFLGFSITLMSFLALLSDLALPAIYFLDSILNTWIPRPNMSCGIVSTFSLFWGCWLGFMAGALLNIEGKFIIINHSHNIEKLQPVQWTIAKHQFCEIWINRYHEGEYPNETWISRIGNNWTLFSMWILRFHILLSLSTRSRWPWRKPPPSIQSKTLRMD